MKTLTFFLLLISALCCELCAAADYTFTTFAGVASSGHVDGAASTARFDNPHDVALDEMGNAYVADRDNHVIRKITPSGTVTTMAGLAGNRGRTDGLGDAARFNTPHALAVDTAGNLYVADRGNHVVRKITPAGLVTTLAGSPGLPGSTDGTGSMARFHCPSGIALDAAGHVFIADSLNLTIRKITPTGLVTTFAGLAGNRGSADGFGSVARFSTPQGVAVDRAGNVYVADSSNYAIRKITPAGEVTTVAGRANGGSNDGEGRTAGFNNPAGVAVDDSGNLFVADTSNGAIRKIAPDGTVTTLAGGSPSGSGDGVGQAAKFRLPYGIALDKSGDAYVADAGNGKIRKITPTGVVTTVAGLSAGYGSVDGVGSAARFNYPGGVALDKAGNLYVLDSQNHTIRKITLAGTVTTWAGLAGSAGHADGVVSAARFHLPSGVAMDTTGNLFVADCLSHTIRKLTPDGAVTTWAGLAASASNGGSNDGGVGVARFNLPRGVAVDGAGNVYVADTGNSTIRKITPAREITTLAGLAGSHGYANGTGSAARFNHPWGIAADKLGQVYVADTDNHTIRKITPEGVVTTIAGTNRTIRSSHGREAISEFFSPRSVAVDQAGNVFVADFTTIHQITPAGVVTTLAGQAHARGSVDGTGSAARFYFTTGIAVDDAGNLYVADGANHTIRKGVRATAARE